MVQWLRLCIRTAEGVGSVLSGGAPGISPATEPKEKKGEVLKVDNNLGKGEEMGKGA